MDKDKETEKTKEKKLRDLTPEKDAKGGSGGPDRDPLPPKFGNPTDPPFLPPDTGAKPRMPIR